VNEIVSTKRFWELMGNPEFIRIDQHTGRIRGKNYKVTTNPEAVEGFIESKINSVIADLSGNRAMCLNPIMLLPKSLRDRINGKP
jgi:hypothetical protein